MHYYFTTELGLSEEFYAIKVFCVIIITPSTMFHDVYSYYYYFTTEFILSDEVLHYYYYLLARPLSCYRMSTDMPTAFLPSCFIYPTSSQGQRMYSLERCGPHSIWCPHKKVGPVQFSLELRLTLARVATILNICDPTSQNEMLVRKNAVPFYCMVE